MQGLAVAPIAITQRAAFGHALTVGQTAQEFEPKERPPTRFAQLYDWLQAQLRY